ncbi:MAG: hypothetical protein B7Z55_13510 [Planctomycetales bacterium 12-60-4]|nr:MAG: hypothetical protein B7Z55_13510 [Planctomycetales bacterium 12-60-4]
MIVLVTRDLFFGSKVTGTAQALGLQATTCASLERLRELLAPSTVAGIILDLGSEVAPADVATLIPEGSAISLLAFGAHVDIQRLEAARAAGFHQVMPRSKFSGELPQLLRGLAQAAE